MKRHVGWFWNIVLPIVLTLLALVGFALAMTDALSNGFERVATWWGWAGVILTVASALTFKFMFHWLHQDDERKAKCQRTS